MTDGRHGTNAGYQRHIVGGTPPCAQCREARRVYRRAHRARTRVLTPQSRFLVSARLLSRLRTTADSAGVALMNDELGCGTVSAIEQLGEAS
jgi:hypothetical protein